MPRPIRARSVEGEENLARRIKREREYRGLSYEGLAKLMTDSGCRIQGSAIYKIEKADPPRRITVDELIAFAEVFDVTVENLLTPVEVLRTNRGKELLKEIDAADLALFQAIERVLNAYTRYFDLAAYEPALREFIDGHRFRDDVADERSGNTPLFSITTDDGRELGHIDDSRLRTAVRDFYLALVTEAGDVTEKVVASNAERGIVRGPLAEDEDD